MIGQSNSVLAISVKLAWPASVTGIRNMDARLDSIAQRHLAEDLMLSEGDFKTGLRQTWRVFFPAPDQEHHNAQRDYDSECLDLIHPLPSYELDKFLSRHFPRKH